MNASNALLTFAFLAAFGCVANAQPEIGQMELDKFECSKCAPKNATCDLTRYPQRLAIGWASGTALAGYSLDTCLVGGDDLPCETVVRLPVFSFSNLNFVRNDIGANPRTKFETVYRYDVKTPDKLDGIKLEQNHRYFIVAQSEGRDRNPSIMLACEAD